MNKPNVLVITQDPSTQEEFREILADEFEHLVALNGVDGLAISRLTRPVVVFVDLNLPHPKVVRICKSLLSNEKVRSIPVIVLADTANVNGELKTLSNFSGVLQRPIQAQHVKSKIQLALEGKPRIEGQEVRKAESKKEGPIRVLSVDDSSVVRKLVTMILTAEGFKVTTASDGVDGINKAKEQIPDVILLDFVMPKMNGFQVCRILQKDERLRQIPVILVTSKGDKVGDKFVNQLGVTGYITKPFQPEELVSKIHQTLEARQPQKEAGLVEEMLEEQPPRPESEMGPTLKPVVAAPKSAPVPRPVQPGADSVKQMVAEMIKAELETFVKTLDKRIEKVVIEKMNDYIRRAKKK